MHEPGDPFGGAPFGQYPSGQQPYSGPPIMVAPPPSTGKANTLATLSLVFAFVFAPAGAVLGHLGLAQIRRTGERGRDRALIGVVLSYVFIVAAVVALVIWAIRPAPSHSPAESGTSAAAPPTSTSAPPAPPVLVTRAQLPNLLLSLDEVKRAMPVLNETYTATDKSGELNGSPGVATVPESCRPALFAGASEVYMNSGSIATFSRSVTSPDVDTLLTLGGVEERVMLYPNVVAAQTQVDELQKRWQGCVGALTETVDYGRGTVHYQVDPVTRAPGNTSIVMLKATMIDGQQGLHGIRNIRAIAAKSNVVVDLAVFSQDPGNSAEEIAAGILARVPG